ncbi:MAG: molybdate ABC transporter substrate-binding protein [Chloroflexi bacterium]|nr:molybdate ABC transporter substrate-binding protein [Chloroflexota bacterium]
MVRRVEVAGLLMMVSIAACGRASGPPGSTIMLTVFAAASLRAVAAEAATAYRRVAGIDVQVASDSSTALRVQIEQGAEADLFLSADTKNPYALAAGGLVNGSVVAFARNGLAIITPGDDPAAIRSAADLARPGVKIVAAGDEVPISVYATKLIAELAADPAFGADFAAAYAANVVSHEDNVKAVVAKIELGEGDAAIVYASDAAASSVVRVIPLPAGINVLATYAGAVPATARHPTEGHALLDWLAGPAGQEILARFGFTPPS